MPHFSLLTVLNGKRLTVSTADWKTPEHIEVKPVYTKEDLEGMEHLRLCCRTSALSAWSVFSNVHASSLDNPPVCRILHC